MTAARQQRNFTAAEDRKLETLARRGFTVAAIAAAVGRSTESVRARMVRLGLRAAPERVSQAGQINPDVRVLMSRAGYSREEAEAIVSRPKVRVGSWKRALASKGGV